MYLVLGKEDRPGFGCLLQKRVSSAYPTPSFCRYLVVSPSAIPYTVWYELEPEEIEQLKVMQTQGPLCAHTQTHLFFLQSPISLTPSEPHSGSLHVSLQLTISKYYDISQQALDLQRLCFDPGTVDNRNVRAGDGTGISLGGRLKDSNVGKGWC